MCSAYYLYLMLLVHVPAQVTHVDTSEEVVAISRCGFLSAYYLEVICDKCTHTSLNVLLKRFGIKDSVHCSEFRGGCFSKVANVLQVWNFQSVPRTLSTLGSVSPSRSVHSGRFYCSYAFLSLLEHVLVHAYIRETGDSLYRDGTDTPLSLNKCNSSELSKAAAISCFRHIIWLTSVSIHNKTLKGGKIHH